MNGLVLEDYFPYGIGEIKHELVMRINAIDEWRVELVKKVSVPVQTVKPVMKD